MSGLQLVIGSRGSALALAQAALVQDALRGHGHRSRVEIIETAGDRRAPDTAWGEGAFVAAIEQALLDGTVDVAAHSAKDVPTEQDPRLRLAAYLPRADPRDALVVRTDATERRLVDLPTGSRVGTDSPRRTGFLLARRPDLVVHPLHGNVDTRLRRLDDGQTDALLLACAGLDRLGLGDRIAERLAPEVVPPAPGQGAIAVQVRCDDGRTLAAVATIDDVPTRLAVEAERTFLSASGGGCRAPIGALATVLDDELDLFAGYASHDGRVTASARRRGPLTAGVQLADALIAELDWGRRPGSSVGSGRPGGARSSRVRVLVTRASDQAAELVDALRGLGLEPIVVPSIAIELDTRSELDAAARSLHTYRWVVITSVNGARAIFDAAERVRSELATTSWAAVGTATRRALERDGVSVAFQPTTSSGQALAADLPVLEGDRVLVVRGDLADERVAETLRARGAIVDDVIAYRTREAPASSNGLLRTAAAGGPIDAALFTSGSSVRGLVALGAADSVDVRAIPAICIGPGTAAVARSAGFRILAIAATRSTSALAATTVAALGRQSEERS